MDGTSQHLSAGDAALSGALRGALAGALLGVVDAISTGTLLSSVAERADLAGRAVLLAAPLGATAGAVLAAIHHWGLALLSAWLEARGGDAGARLRRLSPLPLGVALAPGWAAVAWKLFSGPSASQLELRPVFVVCAFAFLAVSAWGALRIGAEALRFATTRRRALAVSFVSLVGVALASRADQVLYPALYDYLHACLTAAAFGGAWLAVDALVTPRLRRRTALVVVALLAALMITSLSTLGASPTVRATLLDPRASHARSAMLALGPLLSPASRAPEDAIARARRARQRRRAAANRQDLPTWEGAHLLLVTVDALRPDHLGLHGYERPTSPTLDHFAEGAVVFERAYAQAPHSSYSLSSLMTSEYLHEASLVGAELPDETLASSLAAAGYRTTALFPLGIFHTEGERLDRYSESRFHFEHTDDRDLDARAKTDAAIEALAEVARAGEPPSFTWIHYFDVHEPYQATRFGQGDVDRYDSEIAKVDAEIARLLSAAEEALEGELVVVISADHGEEFREHGGVYHGFTLYEEQIRVPLLIRAPGLAARRVSAPVELVDLGPTLLRMLGATVPRTMRGDDLRALATGRGAEIGPAFAGVGPRRMVVRDPHKLVANLRFGVFELFDLEADPRERDNLAARRPELLDDLKAEIFAWLDSLASPPDGEDARPTDPGALALVRGRLGDRRAVTPLIALLEEGDEAPTIRAEAARLLGVLGERRAAGTLHAIIDDASPEVRAEAAIALGRLYDDRAADPLALVLRSASLPGTRARAAISLARVGDERALPALPDAARDAPSRRERNEAIHHLGELGGPAQLESLRALLGDFRSRRPAALALGRLGDARALPILLGVLDTEEHANIRDAVVRALGRLGHPDAIPRLSTLLVTEPGLRSTGESLVRLGAIESGAVGGTDVGPDVVGLEGFTDCRAGDADHPYHFEGRTHCTATGLPSDLPLSVPEEVRETADGVLLVIRLARAEGSQPMDVDLALGDEIVGTLTIDAGRTEHRIPLSREQARRASTLRIDGPAPVWVDHVLLVPRSTTIASAE